MGIHTKFLAARIDWRHAAVDAYLSQHDTETSRPCRTFCACADGPFRQSCSGLCCHPGRVLTAPAAWGAQGPIAPRADVDWPSDAPSRRPMSTCVRPSRRLPSRAAAHRTLICPLAQGRNFCYRVARTPWVRMQRRGACTKSVPTIRRLHRGCTEFPSPVCRSGDPSRLG